MLHLKILYPHSTHQHYRDSCTLIWPKHSTAVAQTDIFVPQAVIDLRITLVWNRWPHIIRGWHRHGTAAGVNDFRLLEVSSRATPQGLARLLRAGHWTHRLCVEILPQDTHTDFRWVFCMCVYNGWGIATSVCGCNNFGGDLERALFTTC